MSEIDFPMFFSTYVNPGYNLSALEEYGFESVYDLFRGQSSQENVSIEGKIGIIYIHKTEMQIISQKLDVHLESQFVPFDFFEAVEVQYFKNIKGEKESDGEYHGKSSLREMMIATRASYPSEKLTITLANRTRHKFIRWINLWLDLSGKQHAVEVFLEDSKRNIKKKLSNTAHVSYETSRFFIHFFPFF